jgi:histidinol-phosphate aminotransferase
LEQFHKLLSPRTPRLVCIANPNAPTGTALTNDEVHALAAASPTTLFLINETFVAFHGRSLLDDGAGLSLPPNLLVLRSLSKDYGLAGMRVGYLVGAPEVIRAVDVARPSFTTSAATLAAALAALGDPAAMEAHVARVHASLERLQVRLAQRKIEALETRCNFLLIRLAAPIQPWAAAFAAHKILVGTSGHAGPMADFIRVTVNDDDEADRFLDVLDVILRMGVASATRVRGVTGRWDDLDSEGMA